MDPLPPRLHGYLALVRPRRPLPARHTRPRRRPDRNCGLWHYIGRENLREANGRGLHAYWQVPDQILDPNFGAPRELLPFAARDKPLYVLEYANTLPRLTHEQTLPEYEAFLRGLPAEVSCACLFGLGLTDDWSRFAITEPVLDWLAALR